MVNDLPVNIVKITFFYLFIYYNTSGNRYWKYKSTIIAFSNWIHFYWIGCFTFIDVEDEIQLTL